MEETRAKVLKLFTIYRISGVDSNVVDVTLAPVSVLCDWIYSLGSPDTKSPAQEGRSAVMSSYICNICPKPVIIITVSNKLIQANSCISKYRNASMGSC